MSDVVFEVWKIVVMVAAGFVAGFLVDLKRNHGNTLDEFITWTNKAVLWAQQVYWAENGQARKAVVMEFLKTLRDQNKFKIPLSDEQISVLIEAAVKEFNEKEGFGYVYLEDTDGDGDEG